MANLGVNLEEVWHQSSLVPAAPATSKRSKYTVPVEPHQLTMREGFANNTEYLAEGGIPISPPPPSPLLQHPPPPLPPPASSSSGSLPSSEIPRLKEQLTQQIDAVSDCQKEVFYLKALIQTLKKELHDAELRRQHQMKVDRKKKMANILWMAFVGLFLLTIVVLLVRLMQKMDRLLSQPLL